MLTSLECLCILTKQYLQITGHSQVLVSALQALLDLLRYILATLEYMLTPIELIKSKDSFGYLRVVVAFDKAGCLRLAECRITGSSN